MKRPKTAPRKPAHASADPEVAKPPDPLARVRDLAPALLQHLENLTQAAAELCDAHDAREPLLPKWMKLKLATKGAIAAIGDAYKPD